MASTKIVVDCTTGEQTEVALTDEEIAVAEASADRVDLDLQGIRGDRNFKLRQSDWTQTVDAPLTTEKKEEWATYRQQLRDFMADKTRQSEFPTDDYGQIAWPQEPS